MAHTVRYPYHGTLSGGTGVLRTQPGAAAMALAGYGCGDGVVCGGVVTAGLGSQRAPDLTHAQQEQRKRAVQAAKAAEAQRTLMSRPGAAEAAKARAEYELAHRAMRPKWQNTADVPLPVPGQTRFGRGTQMRIPGGIHTDTPPPAADKLAKWVSSIVAQGLPQQKRGGRVMIGWARVADTHGDNPTAVAYRNAALTIAAAYAPKKAAADANYAKMVAEGRVQLPPGVTAGPDAGWMASVIAAVPKNMAVQYQTNVMTKRNYQQAEAQRQVAGYGQDAVPTAQSVVAEWEALAAEDPASGPVHSAVMSAAQLSVAEEAPKGTASPEAIASGAAKRPGMGIMVALAAGATAVYMAMR